MKKAFTLIELLIAATIFIIVMTMVASIMGWASNYVAKLREMRSVSQLNRSSVDMISKDIRLANGSLNIQITPTTTKEIGEFAVAYCTIDSTNTSLCWLNSRTPTTPQKLNGNLSGTGIGLYSTVPWGQIYAGNTLIIVQRDQHKFIVYRSAKIGASNYDLYRYEEQLGEAEAVKDYPAFSLATLPAGWSKLSGESSMAAAFSGYTPNKDGRTQQPYIEFIIDARSWDYEILPKQLRSSLMLKTVVESRDYN